jgi:GTP-binding protein
MLTKVAIIGRPNVGKSTLFNRLVGRKVALVHDQPGMTRDRKSHKASLYDISFLIIDTAGLADPDSSVLTEAMARQTMEAIEEADIILFVVDGREGCTPYDKELADILRRKKKPLLVLANKCEGTHGTLGIADAIALGLGDVIPISAEHGEGMYDLYEALHPYIKEEELFEEDETNISRPLQLAIVGRPNVGKSTLINKLIGQERLLTGDMPGVTRDAIAVEWAYQDRPIRLIDTAGMRRRSRIEASTEKLAIMDTERSIQFAEVVVLVIDATTPFDKQDLTIADKIIREGRAMVIAINKWDLVEDKQNFLKEINRILETQLTQVRGIFYVPISATLGKNLPRLMDAVFKVYESWNKRLSTGQLNRWLKYVTQAHPAPAVAGRRIRLKYMTQIKTRPPTFALFASKIGEIPESYIRYLVNNIRQDFDMPGVPIRIYLRTSENPYAED